MNLDLAQTHLQRHVHGLMAVYLFGSQAAGDSTAGSDVDLAVLVQGRLALLELWALPASWRIS